MVRPANECAFLRQESINSPLITNTRRSTNENERYIVLIMESLESRRTGSRASAQLNDPLFLDAIRSTSVPRSSTRLSLLIGATNMIHLAIPCTAPGRLNEVYGSEYVPKLPDTGARLFRPVLGG